MAYKALHLSDKVQTFSIILFRRPVDFYFIWIVSVLMASCLENNSQQLVTGEKIDSLKPPVTVRAKAPIVTLLDTCPPPQTIASQAHWQQRARLARFKYKNKNLSCNPMVS